jgi:hypothetical protein
VGHHIRGFVAPFEPLSAAVAQLPNAQVVPLRLGYGFLPITDQLAGDDEPAPFPNLERLTTRLAEWAGAVSRQFPLAYIETDYFGGDGGQAAIGWRGGQVVAGPWQTTDGLGPERTRTPLLEGAINRVVRVLGVCRGETRDEFDALGLGWHRSNEKWLAHRGVAG